MKSNQDGVYSVFTELFEIGVNRKVLFFYGHNSEGSFVGASINGKGGRKVSSTGISHRVYGESHCLSFQGVIFYTQNEMSRKSTKTH